MGKGGELQQNKGWKSGMAQGEDEVRRIWKDYFGDLYNINTQEEVAVHMCGFDGILGGNYFGAEPIVRAEIEVSRKA